MQMLTTNVTLFILVALTKTTDAVFSYSSNSCHQKSLARLGVL